jgi:transcriptional regulator with GAF, ATPase, and Fis domain
VFLDELGEASLAMQAKLLRVTRIAKIQRVGSPEIKGVGGRPVDRRNKSRSS